MNGHADERGINLQALERKPYDFSSPSAAAFSTRNGRKAGRACLDVVCSSGRSRPRTLWWLKVGRASALSKGSREAERIRKCSKTGNGTLHHTTL